MTSPVDPALLTFPCEHVFKVFAATGSEAAVHEKVLAAVSETLPVGPDALRNRRSSGGKYLCISVSVRVQSMAQIEAIYASLRSVEGVCYLL